MSGLAKPRGGELVLNFFINISLYLSSFQKLFPILKLNSIRFGNKIDTRLECNTIKEDKGMKYCTRSFILVHIQ